jgi:hypothetical protein
MGLGTKQFLFIWLLLLVPMCVVHNVPIGANILAFVHECFCEVCFSAAAPQQGACPLIFRAQG